MNLLFLRHGIAIDREDPKCPPDDFERALTKEGVRKMIEEAKGMRALGIEFDAVLSSPLVRARETAEIVVKHCKPSLSVELCDDLAPGMDVAALLKFLDRKFSDDATVVLVGHEPDFGHAVARLGFGVGSTRFSLKKGGVACVEVTLSGPRSQGSLLWMLTPGLLRAAGAP